MTCPTCNGSGLHPRWGSRFCPFPECPTCGGEPPEEAPEPWTCHDCHKAMPASAEPVWVIEHTGYAVAVCDTCGAPEGKAGAA